jgi:hypothetical protein
VPVDTTVDAELIGHWGQTLLATLLSWTTPEPLSEKSSLGSTGGLVFS